MYKFGFLEIPHTPGGAFLVLDQFLSKIKQCAIRIECLIKNNLCRTPLTNKLFIHIDINHPEKEDKNFLCEKCNRSFTYEATFTGDSFLDVL